MDNSPEQYPRTSDLHRKHPLSSLHRRSGSKKNKGPKDSKHNAHDDSSDSDTDNHEGPSDSELELIHSLERMGRRERYTKYVVNLYPIFLLSPPFHYILIFYISYSVPTALQPFQNAARGIARQSNPFLTMHDIYWAGIEKFYMDQGLLKKKHSILRDRYAQHIPQLRASKLNLPLSRGRNPS